MRVKIVGSAAGGGFPQWNCNADLSRRVRAGEPGLTARTQSSIAVVADGGSNWVLLNASPDLRQQIAATPELQPSGDGLRMTPIAAVVLTNADIDHIAGLLNLRERQPFVLYATQKVLDVLNANPIFDVLDRSIVDRRPLRTGEATAIAGLSGPTGVTIKAYPVAGKVALYMETGQAADFSDDAGDTIGVSLTDAAGSRIEYVPGCARIDERLLGSVANCDALLFDGTVFHDDEMARAGVGTKTGRRMGHVPIFGDGGSLNAFANAGIKRRIYIHINTTNPILDDNSPERATVRAAGWDVAFDGMEVRA